MTIFDRISEDIKKAMLAQNKIELSALRNIKKELLEAKTSKEAAGELTDEISIKVISKIVKQNRDSAIVFKEQNRADLAEEYEQQAEISQRYLPKQMTEAEIVEALKEIAQEVGASSIKELGKLMGVASKRLTGKAEGRLIAEKAKEILSA